MINGGRIKSLRIVAYLLVGPLGALLAGCATGTGGENSAMSPSSAVPPISPRAMQPMTDATSGTSGGPAGSSVTGGSPPDSPRDPLAVPLVADRPVNEAFAASSLVVEPGFFKCDIGRSVSIKSVATDLSSIVVTWQKRDYVLPGGRTGSGALRFEDAKAGLAWIIIVGKAMLLDTRKGQQLANDCKR
jgi:hypothetical protein